MEIAKMSAAQLKKAMDSASLESSKIVDLLIDAGRGNERPNDMMSKSDPLSLKYQKNSSLLQSLYAEKNRRQIYHGSLRPVKYQENPTMATKKFSPAQIAAQKLFAERARAGTLGKGKRKAAVKRKPNPVTETLIYGLAPGETRDYMEELMYAGGQKLTQAQIDKVFKAASDAGYHSFRVAGFDPTIKPDFSAAVRRKRNPDKSKPRAYVKRASQATGAPPSKRLLTRRKKALSAPAGYFPNPKAAVMTGYQVICMHPKKHVVGIFKTMAEAKMVARAMADAKGVAYGVKTVKVHKSHFAV